MKRVGLTPTQTHTHTHTHTHIQKKELGLIPDDDDKKPSILDSLSLYK